MRTVLSHRRGDLLAAALVPSCIVAASLQSVLSIVAPEFVEQKAYSHGQVGFLISAFFLTYGLVQIPAGALADRLGGRAILLGHGAVAAGTALFMISSSFQLFAVARVLQGVGAGMMLPSTSVLFSRLIRRERLARAWSIYGAGAALGNLFVFLVLPSVGRIGGYRLIFLATLSVGVLAVACSFLMPEIRAHVDSDVTKRAAGLAGADLLRLLKRPKVLLLALMNVGAIWIVVGIQAWTPSFLHDVHHASTTLAAALTAGYPLAQLLASPIVATMSSRVSAPRLLLVAFIGMPVLTLALAFIPDLGLAMVALLISGFFAMMSFPPAQALIPSVAEPELVGLACGTLNGIGFVGALAAPWLFGLMVDRGMGYQSGYVMLSSAALVGVAATLFFVRTKTTQLHPQEA
jgi:MFS family permease